MGTWITGTGDVPAEPEMVAYSDNEQYDASGWKASVTLRCPWADRHAVISNILNNSLDWPLRPGLGMLAVSGSVKPMQGSRTQGDTPAVGYTKADLQISFARAAVGGGSGVGSPGGGSESEFAFSETIEPSAQMIQIKPSGEFLDVDEESGISTWRDYKFTYYEGGGDPIPTPPTKLIVGFDYVLQWQGLDDIPPETMSLTGHVNSDEVNSSTLLLLNG